MANWAIVSLATLNIQVSKGKNKSSDIELCHPPHGFMTDQIEETVQ